MPQRVTYHDEQDVENTLKLREVLKTLPGFCRDYFRAMEPTTSTKTRISYAYDIRVFFRFLEGTRIRLYAQWISGILLWICAGSAGGC